MDKEITMEAVLHIWEGIDKYMEHSKDQKFMLEKLYACCDEMLAEYNLSEQDVWDFRYTLNTRNRDE